MAEKVIGKVIGVFTVLIFDPFLISFLISFFRKMG